MAGQDAPGAGPPADVLVAVGLVAVTITLTGAPGASSGWELPCLDGDGGQGLACCRDCGDADGGGGSAAHPGRGWSPWAGRALLRCGRRARSVTPSAAEMSTTRRSPAVRVCPTVTDRVRASTEMRLSRPAIHHMPAAAQPSTSTSPVSSRGSDRRPRQRRAEGVEGVPGEVQPPGRAGHGGRVPLVNGGLGGSHGRSFRCVVSRWSISCRGLELRRRAEPRSPWWSCRERLRPRRLRPR